MDPGWYWRPDVGGVMRVFSWDERPPKGFDYMPDRRQQARQGHVPFIVFDSGSGPGSSDEQPAYGQSYLHPGSQLAQVSTRITQAQALAELAGLGIDTAAVERLGILLPGDGISALDVPPTDLARQRARRWKADPDAQIWACVDFDYLKTSDRQGSRAFHGPIQRPPHGWLLQRGAALVVGVRPDTGNYSVLAQHDFDGPSTARKFVELAGHVDHVLGHNLLQGDYQAIGQVVEIPDDLIAKTVDVQDILLRCEFARRPSIRSRQGLNLTDLTRSNTGRPRSKVHAQAVKEPPVQDCRHTVELWSVLIREGAVTTGRRVTRGAPIDLDQVAASQLRAEIPCQTGGQWHAARRGEPPLEHQAAVSGDVDHSLIAALTALVTDEVMEQLRVIYDRLHSHKLADWHAAREVIGILARHNPPEKGIAEVDRVSELAMRELLISAIQYLSPKLNGQLRTSTGALSDPLIDAYSVALWELTHRKEFDTLVAIASQDRPAPRLILPLAQESFEQHRLGACRVARGEDPEIPAHYVDLISYLTENSDAFSVLRWLQRLESDPILVAWRDSSPAARKLRNIPAYRKIIESAGIEDFS